MKLIFSLILLLLTFISHAQLIGKVVGISDGDTFTLLDSNKTQHRIRIYGIDCPEYGQDYGQVAKKFTSDFIYKKQVFVKIMDTDRYGRTVGVVYTLPDSANLNEALLKAGLAWHYKYYDHNPNWSKLEEEARSKKLGLWQRADATPPWEYRRYKRGY